MRVLIGVVLALWLSPAFAQQQSPPQTAPAQPTPKPATPESNWITRCTSQTRAGSLDCVVEQSVIKTDTRQVVALFRVQVAGDTRAPVMLMQLPLGLHLPAGIGLQVDEQKMVALSVHTCDAGGCYVTGPLAADLLGQLQAGKTLRLRFQNLANESIDVTMPLAGFANAFAAIK